MSRLYVYSVYLPRNAGMALHVSITPIPWTPDAFMKIGAGSFEFGL
jgi:hypothetical protein